MILFQTFIFVINYIYRDINHIGWPNKNITKTVYFIAFILVAKHDM